ncbi:unnamed protein product, partial [Ectocarpus sp. 4 AP-2014]
MHPRGNAMNMWVAQRQGKAPYQRERLPTESRSTTTTRGNTTFSACPKLGCVLPSELHISSSKQRTRTKRSTKLLRGVPLSHNARPPASSYVVVRYAEVRKRPDHVLERVH